MKGKTKYMKAVRKNNSAMKKLMTEKSAIQIFTMFIAPVKPDDKDSEDMVFGYTIAGEMELGMGEVITQLRGMVDQIETDLLKQVPDEKKA